MKKQFFFSMLAAAAMMASCSSDKIVENSANNEYGLVEGQPAFLRIGIAMPASAQTRANDDFHDGVADEYAVKDAQLFLFKGATEAGAKLFGVYDVDPTWNKDGSTNQITSTSTNFVQEISSPNLGVGEKLWAYVILNAKANDTKMTYVIGTTTFADFSAEKFKAIGIATEADGFGAMGSNGLVMTNVPLASQKGGDDDPTGSTITTLAPIDKTAIYETAAAASDPSAKVTCIYVERAAVKVQVKYTTSLPDPAGTSTPVSIAGWTLGNVNNGGASGSGYWNTRSFNDAWLPYNNVKNGTASTLYRMVCATPLYTSSDHQKGYRTYFGQDVNYDGNTGLITPQVADVDHTLASGDIVYTYENTFDENNQLYKNTTYVSFKTSIFGGNTFYTIQGQNNTALDLANLKNALAQRVDVEIGSSTINTIKTTIEGLISTNAATLGLSSSDVVKFDLEHVVDVDVSAADGLNQVPYTDHLVLANVTKNGAADASLATAINNLDYAASLKVSAKLAENLIFTHVKVNYYKNGVAYYTARIAHFGDAETPWSAPESAYNKYNEIYPTSGVSLHTSPITYSTSRESAWLGRWGIVRNNWYVLEVDGIKGIGSAAPLKYDGVALGPDGDVPGDTPDDNPDPQYYISAHIHILPWVLRTQNVIL